MKMELTELEKLLLDENIEEELDNCRKDCRREVEVHLTFFQDHNSDSELNILKKEISGLKEKRNVWEKFQTKQMDRITKIVDETMQLKKNLEEATETRTVLAEAGNDLAEKISRLHLQETALKERKAECENLIRGLPTKEAELQLYWEITRIMWDYESMLKEKKELSRMRGFVIDKKKTNLIPFSFDESNSNYYISNHLWKQIESVLDN